MLFQLVRQLFPISLFFSRKHSRRLNSAEIRKLLCLAKELKVELQICEIRRMMQAVINLESYCHGRLACRIFDAIIRILTLRSINKQMVNVLEIGSLFGLGLFILFDQCKGYFSDIQLAAIDPFHGYYGDAIDKQSGVHVTEQIFEKNRKLSQVPDDKVTLIPYYSTDIRAIKAAQVKLYDLIIVDGDHSYRGIKSDVTNYIEMLNKDGILFIDDYARKAWPDVTRFVKSELLSDSRLEKLFTCGNSIAFKYV